MHWFNPNVEGEVAAGVAGRRFVRKRMMSAMEEDVEAVVLAGCRSQDVWLARKPPSRGHLADLESAGVEVPRIVGWEGRFEVPRGGLRPWAWSPEVIGGAGWRFGGDGMEAGEAGSGDGAAAGSGPEFWFSKEAGLRLSGAIGSCECGVACRSVDEAERELRRVLRSGPALVKGAYACAGRDHLVIRAGEEAGAAEELRRLCGGHGVVVVEKLRERVFDFSALYEKRGGEVRLVGMSTMRNDGRGRFLGSVVRRDWAGGLPAAVAERWEADGLAERYAVAVPEAVAGVLPGYEGPVGVDAMFYRPAGGGLGLVSVVEMNVRMTMGRVALDLLEKAGAESGELRILRKREVGDAADARLLARGTLSDGLVVLNDPARAAEFLVVWEAGVAGP